MCPDRQLLSLHLDGEMPSPWKEKLESHLASCPACSSALDAYRGVSRAVSSVPSDGLEAAKARIWKNLAGLSAVPAARTPSPWRRRIAVPLPAAVAAVLAVALLSAGGMGLASAGRGSENMVAVAQSPQNLAVPVSDIGSVLRYLESQDSAGDIVIIRLPEAANFYSSGEPTLIRAADYSGRPSY